MQLQTSATLIDFFPTGSKDRFTKCVTWHPGAESEMKSFSTVTRMQFMYDANNYIANGATVVDFNTDQYAGTEYTPMMC
jgi:hypothetical protein